MAQRLDRVWAWKLETLQTGENITIAYNLTGLEKGDWTETDVFYRGSQESIRAMKMDEKYLEEIRNQEKIMLELNSNSQLSDNVEKSIDTEPAAPISDRYLHCLNHR